MKRRELLKNLGLGVGAITLTPMSPVYYIVVLMAQVGNLFFLVKTK